MPPPYLCILKDTTDILNLPFVSNALAFEEKHVGGGRRFGAALLARHHGPAVGR